MYANCSTTAQRGALDWWRPFRDATKPVFERLYESVENGSETRRTLEANSRPAYKVRRGVANHLVDCVRTTHPPPSLSFAQAELAKELAELAGSEMWVTGKAVRALRPENAPK